MPPKVDGAADGVGDILRREPIRGTGLLKGVTIQEPEEISESDYKSPGDASQTLACSQSPKLHRASISGKRLSGRSSVDPTTSTHILNRQLSTLSLDQGDSDRDAADEKPSEYARILSQVVTWLREEKAKETSQKPKVKEEDDDEGIVTSPGLHGEAGSDAHGPEEGLALEKLERLLGRFITRASENATALGHRVSPTLRRKGSVGKRMKPGSVNQSSDTEYQDGTTLVPNVDAELDNSKTIAYTNSAAENDFSKIRPRDKEQWVAFKSEIVRLTHTLRLKGWRRVPLDRGEDIDVERLSGALTNAVYVVSPPKQRVGTSLAKDSTTSLATKRLPSKLLLRIYGPQVEHLIDREEELAILRRLARKRIGPRLLGTFNNGRFEEFFHAHTLTAEDLRVPETSKQIAKRMRELHDGIELLEEEREGGPFVWKNWDKWVNRCEQVITWLDKQIESRKIEAVESQPAKRWMKRGYVCGVEWSVFRKTVEKARKYIENACGGKNGVKQQLVFAHNDTQYGNLLRLQPSGESPLLHPSNEHKQLVVIDFEYANANTPGMEFANHFTEWCYNYHHPTSSFACNSKAYPTPQEQHRFVRSYVMHRPQFNPAASSTPKLTPRDSYISGFMLDSRTPPGSAAPDYDTEEKAREDAAEKEIQKLIHETKMWRVANSAQWVAWGIVQAKVPELDETKKAPSSHTAAIINKIKVRIHPQSDPLDPEIKALQDDGKADRPEGRAQDEAHQEGDEGEDEHEEFDYLTYAQDRALFFWGDCLQLGLIKEDELPERMRGSVKIVEY